MNLYNPYTITMTYILLIVVVGVVTDYVEMKDGFFTSYFLLILTQVLLFSLLLSFTIANLIYLLI